MDTSTINVEWTCTCDACASGRLVHWKCDGCGAGPFKFSFADPGDAKVKTPYGQRQYNRADGLVGGIRRWCSASCAKDEEKVYLLDQLDKAHARRDVNSIRILTGRLHEMANAEPQIPNLTEKHTRREAPPKVDVDADLETTVVQVNGVVLE